MPRPRPAPRPDRRLDHDDIGSCTEHSTAVVPIMAANAGPARRPLHPVGVGRRQRGEVRGRLRTVSGDDGPPMWAPPAVITTSAAIIAAATIEADPRSPADGFGWRPHRR
ncbi:hypothetical protein [Mycolicibacterium hippocampi]|uniref:hypothetical protein n=1 Tax=Mycolicibacterium hippocampi TaxID=659824 RepID=UPI0013D889B6|nr:hypothetical protein [Mycolicibacterium hippocampi]